MRRAVVLRVLAVTLCLGAAVTVSLHGPRPLVLLAVVAAVAGALYIAWRLPVALTAAGGCVLLAETLSLLFVGTHDVPWRALAVAVLLALAMLVADAAESLPPGADAMHGLLLTVRRRAVPALVAAATLAAVVAFTAAQPVLQGAAVVVVGMVAAAGAVLMLVIAAPRRHRR